MARIGEEEGKKNSSGVNTIAVENCITLSVGNKYTQEYILAADWLVWLSGFQVSGIDNYWDATSWLVSRSHCMTWFVPPLLRHCPLSVCCTYSVKHLECLGERQAERPRRAEDRLLGLLREFILCPLHATGACLQINIIDFSPDRHWFIALHMGASHIHIALHHSVSPTPLFSDCFSRP